jgi:hypothetical protein
LDDNPSFDESGSPDKWPELFQLTRDCDLLVIVLDPDTLIDQATRRQMQDAVVRHSRLQARSKPRGMVALAYSKADEYGFLGRPRRRYIANRTQRDALLRCAQTMEAGGDLSTAWRQLRGHLCPDSDSIKATRGRLLDLTEGLWRGLISAEGVNLARLNAYLVTARPSDPHMKPLPLDRRGLLELFEDFFQTLVEQEARPKLRTWQAACVGVAGLLILSGVASHLWWGRWWAGPASAAALALASAAATRLRDRSNVRLPAPAEGGSP